MGLLDKLRGAPPAEPWKPPLRGLCACPGHLDSLVDQTIAASPGITVAELSAQGAVTASPALETYLFDPPTGEGVGQRRGPFHWTLSYTPAVRELYDDDAPADFDDMFYIQPGIENLLRTGDDTFVVGAPLLCSDGVEAALMKALLNPRVRQAD